MDKFSVIPSSLLFAIFSNVPLLKASFSSLISFTEILGGSGNSSRQTGEVDVSGDAGSRSGRLPGPAPGFWLVLARGEGTGFCDSWMELRDAAVDVRFEGDKTGAGEVGMEQLATAKSATFDALKGIPAYNRR